MIKILNKINDLKSLVIFNYCKFISNFNKYKFRSNRGLGDLFIDILFLNWLSNKSKKKIYLFCRSEHINLVSDIADELVIIKEISTFNYFLSRDLWRNKNAQERSFILNKSLSARYLGFYNSIINRWYLHNEELKSISQIIPSSINQNAQVKSRGKKNNTTNILIVNSIPLSGQCNKDILKLLDDMIYILVSNGYQVNYTRNICALGLDNKLHKISINQIKSLLITSETVIGVATGPFWFSYLNYNLQNRIGITDVDILNFSSIDKSISSSSFIKWYTSNFLSRKIIKLDDVLLDLRKYYKKS